MNTIPVENISAFLSQLREDGLLVGPAEAQGVLSLLAALADLDGTGGAGLTDRRAVRESLKAMLAKSQKEARIFEQRFDDFFVGGSVLVEREVFQEIQAAQRQRRINTAREALTDFEIEEELAEAYGGAGAERQAWLRNMLDFAQSGNRNLPLMKEYLKKIASGWIAAEAGVGAGGVDEEEDNLLHKNLNAITEDEIPQALHLIEALVRRVNLQTERRHLREGRRGMPDLRRTIHASLRTGGVPVNPVYKKRPRTTRRTVILCDISESMILFSEFALKFITALGRERGKTRAFIFSEGAEEIGLEDLTRFEQTVKQSALWRRGTDIGGALAYISDLRPPALDAAVTLIVLSDARTVAQPLAEAAASEAQRQVRTLLWLNPDPQFSPFAKKIAEHVPMLRCNTLDELARACARLSK
jgi:uncharacterized protein with von Willebrand factor type A (vWA) domain